MSNYMTCVMQNLELAQRLGNLNSTVESKAKELSKIVNNGGIIFIGGNAGAGSNAEHFVSELVGRFYKNRKGLPSISLNSDTTTITCISNDFGFENIFARQLESLFDPKKDIFIGMSTSGNSKNIIEAAKYLDSVDGEYILLSGGNGGNLNLFKNNIVMPTYDTPRVQEAHMFVLHYWAQYIEENMEGDE